MDEILILADPKSPSWEFAKGVAKKISDDYSNVVLCKVIIQRFNDGEIKPILDGNVRQKDVFFIHDSSKPSQEWWVELMLVNDALRRASASGITNVLPYLPYSRQDRKDQSRVPISSKVLADTISLNATRVITMDLHANQIQGFYNVPVDTLESFNTACEYISKSIDLKNLVVVSPDIGGGKRARKFASLLEKPLILTDKERVIDGEIENMYIMGNVSGKDALVVDDLVDSGGTLIEVAKRLREKGVNRLYVYVTHPVFSNGASLRLSEIYDTVYISDTIPSKVEHKIEIISMVNIFAEAIYRANKGLSISKLFK